jgi:hypothetical protein
MHYDTVTFKFVVDGTLKNVVILQQYMLMFLIAVNAAIHGRFCYLIFENFMVNHHFFGFVGKKCGYNLLPPS